jgi:hypothetical protein
MQAPQFLAASSSAIAIFSSSSLADAAVIWWKPAVQRHFTAIQRFFRR